MEYKTYVFEEKNNKDKYYRSHYVIIFVFLVVNIFSFIYFGAGIGIISSIGFTVFLFNAANEEKKKMGLKAHGRRLGELTITEDHFLLKNKEIRYDEVSNLTIYVDEFTGMTKDLFWSHHGGNNEICFDYLNKYYSFNYLIHNKRDFQHVEKLVDLIEEKYSSK